MYLFIILIELLSKFASHMERAWITKRGITQRGSKISFLYVYIDVYIKVGLSGANVSLYGVSDR